MIELYQTHYDNGPASMTDNANNNLRDAIGEERLMHIPSYDDLSSKDAQAILEAIWYYIVCDGKPQYIAIHKKDIPKRLGLGVPITFKEHEQYFNDVRIELCEDEHLFIDGRFQT